MVFCFRFLLYVGLVDLAHHAADVLNHIYRGVIHHLTSPQFILSPLFAEDALGLLSKTFELELLFAPIRIHRQYTSIALMLLL
jgi:hypothetical protein